MQMSNLTDHNFYMSNEFSSNYIKKTFQYL
jgi:hypothetical protein